MNANKGYYSLIQFCPDPSRMEAVNVGVVLSCPGLKFVRAKTAHKNDRPAKLVGRNGFSRASLNAAKLAIHKRLEVAADQFATAEGFQQFVDTRANALTLTSPRPVKVFNPESDLQRLFDELVGGKSASKPLGSDHLPPALDATFKRLSAEGRAKLNLEVIVPLLQQPLHIPYAYQNGVFNLVKPQHFAATERRTLATTMQLAVEGDLLYRNREGNGVKRQLIIVPTFDTADQAKDVESRVGDILNAYHVKTVSRANMDSFLEQVIKEAHA